MESNSRFTIENGVVKDLFSSMTKRTFCAADLPEEYLETKYQPGFIQPAAFVDGKIILEETEGEPLQMDVMEEDVVLKKVLPLGNALKWMHKRKKVYGNLSPESIIDTKDGFFIKDFGIGVKQDDEKRNAYSAYEYYAYQGKGCPASDVYSLAAIIYELLTGIQLDTAANREDAMDGSMESDIEPLSAFGVSLRTEFAISKALSVYSDDRYNNMGEFLENLYSKSRLEAYISDFNIETREFRYEEEKIAEKMEKKAKAVKVSDGDAGDFDYEEDEDRGQVIL